MVNKGEIFIITSGNYSDYSVVMSLRALRDITEEEIEAIYTDEISEYTYAEHVSDSLVASGAAEIAVSKEVHVDTECVSRPPYDGRAVTGKGKYRYKPVVSITDVNM